MPKSYLSTVPRKINDFIEHTTGYRMRKARPTINSKYPLSYAHSVITTYATYSPWLDCADFQGILEYSKKNTLIDQNRLYELYAISKQAVSYGGAFLQVGVWKGGSSIIIQKAISTNGPRRIPFYIADTFAGVVKAGSKYDSRYRGGEHADASEENVRSLFKQAKLPVPTILKGVFPDDFQNSIKEKISFLHCDVDAYQSTKDIIEWAIPRLTNKAVIVVDDYGWRACEGVTRCVEEIVVKNSDLLLIYNLNGHAVLVKC